MRRAPILFLTLALPATALIIGSAASAAPATAPSRTPTLVATATQGGASASRAARTPAGLPKIKGAVGPGFTIKVKPGTVTAGKYKMIVNDKGTIHNFHITGPGGVDEATSVPGTGRTVWKLKLVQGTYNIVCDPHSQTMHTTLTVT